MGVSGFDSVIVKQCRKTLSWMLLYFSHFSFPTSLYMNFSPVGKVFTITLGEENAIVKGGGWKGSRHNQCLVCYIFSLPARFFGLKKGEENKEGGGEREAFHSQSNKFGETRRRTRSFHPYLFDEIEVSHLNLWGIDRENGR